MLSPEQINFYHQNGYVVPDLTLPGETIMAIKADHDRLLIRHPEFTDYCGALLIEDLAFLNYARNPNILDLIEQLIGSNIALWNASLFAKPAKVGSKTPWHQDGQYWPIEPLATCTVWIALDDATIENGCLRFLPGSHQNRKLESHHHNDGAGLSLPLELDPQHINEADAVSLELKAGQLSLHDVYLKHASDPNRSANPRRGMTLRFMPTTSVYRRDLNKSPVDGSRPVFLMRGHDKSGQNDFQVR
jgi:ectoine hydroxylase-related dioxygenase (phytanoyl-CoA dioxygenase family)